MSKVFARNNHLTGLAILLMVLIPFSVQMKQIFVVTIIGISIFVGNLIFKDKHLYLLYLAVFLCIPSGLAAWNVESSEINLLNRAIRHWIIWPIIILSCIRYRNRDSWLASFVFFSVLPCIFICFMEFLIWGNDSEWLRVYPMLASGAAMLIMTYNDDSLSFDDFYDFISILFVISSIYVLMQFWGVSPYKFIDETLKGDIQLQRLAGLLGHPLYLAFFACFFQSLIFAKKIITGKFDILLEILVLIIGIVTVSRVVILSLFIQLVIFLFLSKRINVSTSVFGVVIFFIIGYYILSNYASHFILNYLDRFENGDTDHRLAAYYITFYVFLNNIYGVGFFNVMSNVYSSHIKSDMLIENFSTIDNLFLTHVIAYGIFSVFFLYYYFYPLISLVNSSFFYTHYKSAILIVYTNIFVFAFVMDWETSLMASSLVFVINALLVKRAKLTKSQSTRNLY